MENLDIYNHIKDYLKEKDVIVSLDEDDKYENTIYTRHAYVEYNYENDLIRGHNYISDQDLKIDDNTLIITDYDDNIFSKADTLESILEKVEQFM